jgi:hypothetical protein
MALPMALGVMLVLSISIFATLQFTGASSRESSLNETRQRAKGFAEAGVNYGASRLAQELADDANFASDLPQTNTTIQGAPVTWRATYQIASSPKTWLVRATATLPNPTGPTAAPIPRTVEAQFQWAPTGPGSPWHGLYVGNPGTFPLMSNAEASIATDVYVNGDVTMQQGKILGSSFQVWGSLTLDTSAWDETSIGASDRASCSDYRSFKSNFPLPCSRTTHRVATFKTRDGCRFNTSAAPAHTSCSTTSRMGGPSGKIWLTCPSCADPAPYPSSTPGNSTNYVSTAYSTMTAADTFVLTAPNVPPALADYDLGPGKPCVTPAGAPSFTASSTDIMGSTSYSCVSPDGAGELSWIAGSTNTLTARGTIYFQGQLELQSGRWGLVAAGSDGEIFVRDKLILKPGTGLCGIRGTTAPLCNPSWDPQAAGANLVSFMVGSNQPDAILQDSFHFQGGLYTDEPTGGYLNKNNSTFKGPTTFEGPVQLQNHGTIDAWAPASPPSAPSGGSMELTLIRGSWRG